ncbi:uncharacterized protein LOC128244123 [Mya arenaria]|uniref:uncharacterized protein LOC128244123 n=1 Tax=Mya arenaria TaxID=6604 RepID=UPI0022E66D53|nr:uncharacterized protein LOC128244123 [Mya arenaria]
MSARVGLTLDCDADDRGESTGDVTEAENAVNESRELGGRGAVEYEWKSLGFESDSLFQKSNVDVQCDACLADIDDPRTVEAIVFCRECGENLCRDCRKHHRRFRLTRGHQLYPIAGNEETIPKTAETERCKEHADKFVEYFCDYHGELCCKSCKDISHSQCIYVKFIPDEAGNVRAGDEINAYQTNISSLKARVEDTMRRKNNYMNRIEKQEQEAITRINGLTNVATEVINRLAKDAEDEVRGFKQNVALQTSNELDTLEEAKKALNRVERKMTMILKSANNAQIFITLKESLGQCKKYASFLETSSETTHEAEIKFYTNKRFEAMLQSVTSIGSIVQDDVYSMASLPSSQSSSASSLRKRLCDVKQVRKWAQPIGGHSIRLTDDKTTCCISGCKFLPGRRLVCADYNNHRIKLFDEKIRLLDHFPLKSRPSEIAVLDSNKDTPKFATMLIEEQCFQVMSVTQNRLNLETKIPTNYQYSGFDFSPHSDEIFASYPKEDGSGQIHVIDLTGNIVRTIDNYLVRPTAVHIDPECDMLYVSDSGRNCVVGFDLVLDNGRKNEEPVFNYTDRSLELRSAIVADTDDNVFVSSGSSVHQITREGTKVCESLTRGDGLGVAHCLAYCKQRNILLVSEYKENTVKLFTLLPKC